MTVHGSTRQYDRSLASFVPLMALALGSLSALLAGCVGEDRTQALVAQTDAFCAANPVRPFPASVSARSVYIGTGALTKWQHRIPQRLLQEGFVEVEAAASMLPSVKGSGDYLRFRVAPASDPGCAGQRALAESMEPDKWQTVRRLMFDWGLRPDQCLAIERTAERRSEYWVEVWDSSADLPAPGFGVPVHRERRRFVATAAATGRVLHEHFSEHGFLKLSFSVPFGCMRLDESTAFFNKLVRGTGGAIGSPPTVIEPPPDVAVLRSDPLLESVSDLGLAPIEHAVLWDRAKRSLGPAIEGVDLLEGDSPTFYEAGPNGARYLQFAVDGEFRRVRLTWLEGSPHGQHDRPVRMFDLDGRIGILSVTRRIQVGSRGAIDLSWAELARDSGLLQLRADAVVPIDPDSSLDSLNLIENMQHGPEGLRFSVTEVGLGQKHGVLADHVLLRESRYRWGLDE